jgi:DNA gyrase/topoisomerase IV subunit A
VLIGLMKQDLEEMVEQYGDERRTVISDEEVGNFVAEDLIPVEMMVVTVTHQGYIKRTALDQYRTQGRGGKGVSGAETKEGDFLWNLFVASTHDYLLFFTDRGRVLLEEGLRAAELRPHRQGPLAGQRRRDAGRREDHRDPARRVVRRSLPGDRDAEGPDQEDRARAYSRPRAGGIIAVGLEDGDSLVGVNLCRPARASCSAPATACRSASRSGRARDGPQRRRRLGHPPRGGRRGLRHGRHRRHRHAADDLRERLRQAHAGRGVPPAVARRQGHHRHQAPATGTARSSTCSPSPTTTR